MLLHRSFVLLTLRVTITRIHLRVPQIMRAVVLDFRRRSFEVSLHQRQDIEDVMPGGVQRRFKPEILQGY